MERIDSELIYTDLEDGESFGIFNMVDGEAIEAIYMSRDVAIEMALDILDILGDE